MEKCHVIFPGKFKPVHSGHIEMMFKYLDSTKYDVDLTIVISKIPKDGLTPETSKSFLDQIFIKNKRVHVVIAENNSPIVDSYNMIAQKTYGNGIYAMGTSSKGSDIKRAEDIVSAFAPDGKYYTPGVKVIKFPVDFSPIHYVNRKDAYANAEISSTILRNDINNKDYVNFKTGYTSLINEGKIKSEVLSKYFLKLVSEICIQQKRPKSKILKESYCITIGSPLFEGGAAGHIPHPYEINSFTFFDLKDLIFKLFTGKITSMTEKLDGQNLFASVDEYGNTIFARNNKHLTQDPWYLKDIENNPKWIDSPKVQHAFTNAAITIDKIFKNIENPIKFFNLSKNEHKWVDLEIIDTNNSNVIPYEKSMVSFHCIKLVKNIMDKSIPTVTDDPNNDADLKMIQTAIDKTTRIPFEAQLTKSLDISSSLKNNTDAYVTELDDIESRYKLSDNDTILEYKKRALDDYIHHVYHTYISFIDGDLFNALINRWLGTSKKQTIKDICKNYKLGNGEYLPKENIEDVSNFEKNELPLILSRIMSPLDELFIRLGNEIISHTNGLINANKSEVISKLNKNLDKIKNKIRSTGDEKSKYKLEKSLKRLSAVDMQLTQSEGIVFTYKSHTLKLTGAFAPLNQILGLQNV